MWRSISSILFSMMHALSAEQATGALSSEDAVPSRGSEVVGRKVDDDVRAPGRGWPVVPVPGTRLRSWVHLGNSQSEASTTGTRPGDPESHSKPTQTKPNHTKKKTQIRPCPQALRSARDAWRIGARTVSIKVNILLKSKNINIKKKT